MYGGGKLAGKDEAVDALLQSGNVHDLCEVTFHGAQLPGITCALVLGMLALEHNSSLYQLVMVCPWTHIEKIFTGVVEHRSCRTQELQNQLSDGTQDLFSSKACK